MLLGKLSAIALALAVIALTILVGMFLFVFIGPIFAPVDLTETGSEMLHVNVRPTMSLMKLPDDMKDGAVDISSRGTFTIGVSEECQDRPRGSRY